MSCSLRMMMSSCMVCSEALPSFELLLTIYQRQIHLWAYYLVLTKLIKLQTIFLENDGGFSKIQQKLVWTSLTISIVSIKYKNLTLVHTQSWDKSCDKGAFTIVQHCLAFPQKQLKRGLLVSTVFLSIWDELVCRGRGHVSAQRWYMASFLCNAVSGNISWCSSGLCWVKIGF